MTNKPDISKLLELTKKAQRLMSHGDPYETLPSCKKYRKEISPDKMIALLEYVQGLEKKSTQRGARMQILNEILSGIRILDRNTDEEMSTWFDRDGVPL